MDPQIQSAGLQALCNGERPNRVAKVSCVLNVAIPLPEAPQGVGPMKVSIEIAFAWFGSLLMRTLW
jgi:hypothetical protein